MAIIKFNAGIEMRLCGDIVAMVCVCVWCMVYGLGFWNASVVDTVDILKLWKEKKFISESVLTCVNYEVCVARGFARIVHLEKCVYVSFVT